MAAFSAFFRVFRVFLSVAYENQAAPNFDQKISGSFPAIGGDAFLVNEFERSEVYKPGNLWQKRFKEALQDGGPFEQHFKERIMVHGIAPMRLMFHPGSFYFKTSGHELH